MDSIDNPYNHIEYTFNEFPLEILLMQQEKKIILKPEEILAWDSYVKENGEV